MTDRHFHTLKIAKIIQRTELASTIELEIPADLAGLFKFKAGQYLTFKTLINGEELRRSYSINSNDDGTEALQVTVKKVPDGRVSNYFVDTLKAGDSVEVMPPLGQFVLSSQITPKTYFYAAGSGITPIFGLIKTLLSKNPSALVNLQYGNFQRDQVIFYTEFEQLKRDNSQRFELCHHYTDGKPQASAKGFFGKMFAKKTKETESAQESAYQIGDFTSEKLITLSKLENDFSSSNHYICGPGQMIPELEKTLLDLGVTQANIFHEYFAAAVDTVAKDVQESSAVNDKTGSAQLTVTLDGDTDTFELPAGETILRASIEEGLSVPYACESGVCSTCKAKCISGEVKMRSNSVLSDDEIADGYILTCQSEAVSKDVVVDYDAV